MIATTRTSENDGRVRLDSTSRLFAAAGALFCLFLAEVGWSLWSWRHSGYDSLWVAATYSTVFLAFFWMTLLVVGELFCLLLERLGKFAPGTVGLGGKILLTILVIMGWVFTASSLATRYMMGCYLNLSLLRFALAIFLTDYGHTW
jgi:hypothetical protein